MGMKGAALATISGQIVTALMAIWYLAKKNKAFRLKRASFHLSGHLLRRFLPLGISSFITQVSIVAIMAAMNNVLVIYGAKSPYGADIPMTEGVSNRCSHRSGNCRWMPALGGL